MWQCLNNGKIPENGESPELKNNVFKLFYLMQVCFSCIQVNLTLFIQTWGVQDVCISKNVINWVGCQYRSVNSYADSTIILIYGNKEIIEINILNIVSNIPNKHSGFVCADLCTLNFATEALSDSKKLFSTFEHVKQFKKN